MQKWEYAWLNRTDGWRGQVGFSHPQERWEPIEGEEFSGLLKRLGDEGWELVSVAFHVVDTLWFKRAIPQ